MDLRFDESSNILVFRVSIPRGSKAYTDSMFRKTPNDFSEIDEVVVLFKEF